MPAAEHDLIYRYFASLGAGDSVELSVGDDCAILRLEAGERVATSVDTLVEGIHFLPETFPEDVGYRCVAAAASDLAAVGARPLGMTVALSVPAVDELWLHSFSEGLAAAVADFRLPLVGGDITRGALTIAVQVLGALPADRALLRSGASEGDAVYVSGTLGDAAGGLAILREEWLPAPEHAEYLLQRLSRPPARLELGRELLASATAAIDISDGLLADAGHIADASGVRIVIDPECLPLSEALRSHASADQVIAWALTGGDDYELCFCLPPGMPAPAATTCIGRVTAGAGVDCGLAIAGPGGYDHFGDA